MYRLGLAVLFLAGDCFAHPGHGAPLPHIHGSDWSLLVGAGAVVVAAVLAWRGK